MALLTIHNPQPTKFGSSTLLFKKGLRWASVVLSELYELLKHTIKRSQFHLVMLVPKLDTQPEPERKQISIGQTSKTRYGMDPPQYLKEQSY